ncbi:MAG: hypothetical protein DSY58_05380 [Desulfobulbus sp.]|nr:MAG: hypothetical protein DSY58_05380 [Desulfobulbus sp.]
MKDGSTEHDDGSFLCLLLYADGFFGIEQVSSCHFQMIAPEKQICRVLTGRTAEWCRLTDNTRDNILAVSIRHGVHGLLYFALKKYDLLKDLTENQRAYFQRKITQQTGVELQRSHALHKVLSALAKESIIPVVIKGEALAHTHYQRSSTRERGDIDLFIAPGDISQTIITMTGQGYYIPGPLYKSHQFSCLSRKENRSGCHFDIHWRINNLSRFAKSISYPDALAESVKLPGVDHGITLCEEHALLLACMHLDGFRQTDRARLIWVYDIHLLLHSMGEDTLISWAESAVEKQVGDACSRSILQARHYFDSPVPESVWMILKKQQPAVSLGDRFSQTNLGLLIADLQDLPGSRARSLLFLELFFPSPDNLLALYKKTNRMWLPYLYCRQIIQGVIKRLSLR